MDLATAAQLLSSIATLVVALGILYQGRQARKARDDQDRPQIIVDADYTGRFTTKPRPSTFTIDLRISSLRELLHHALLVAVPRSEAKTTTRPRMPKARCMRLSPTV